MLYMLDTNILSYLLEGDDSIRSRLFSVLPGNSVELPETVYYEVQQGLFYRNSRNKQARFDAFCESFPIRSMTKTTLICAARIYADLRERGQLIEDSDIFIGATAFANNATLVTNNVEHLGRIEGLKIENWTC